MSRYSGPARFRLSSSAARRYTNAGRKLAGEVLARDTPVLALEQTLDDGAVVTAERVGGQLTISLAEPPPRGRAASDARQDILWAFIGSPGGLRIFDLGSKTLVKTVTGLEAYGVDALARGGKLVYMAAHGGGSVARVDLSSFTAIAAGYAVSTPASTSPSETAVVAGAATGFDGLLSPDGGRYLVHFEGSGLTSGGSITLREGMGGFVLADATSLLQVRAPIRMTFEPFPAAWRADSQRFYLGTAVNADAGDIDNPSIDLLGLQNSQSDFISVFDRDGALLISHLVASFSFVPGGGFPRRVQALACSSDGAWLAAILTGDGSARSLHLYSTADDSLAELASLDLASAASALPTSLAFAVGDRRLSLVIPDVGVVDVVVAADGALSDPLQTSSDALRGYGPDRDWAPDRIVNAPRGQTQRPPPGTQFFYNARDTASTRLIGYRNGFNRNPIYEYDLAGLTLDNKYRIAAVGVRPSKGIPQ